VAILNPKASAKKVLKDPGDPTIKEVEFRGRIPSISHSGFVSIANSSRR